jgi:hypothetical protein
MARVGRAIQGGLSQGVDGDAAKGPGDAGGSGIGGGPSPSLHPLRREHPYIVSRVAGQSLLENDRVLCQSDTKGAGIFPTTI